MDDITGDLPPLKKTISWFLVRKTIWYTISLLSLEMGCIQRPNALLTGHCPPAGLQLREKLSAPECSWVRYVE